MKKLLFGLLFVGFCFANYSYPQNSCTINSATVGTSNTTIFTADASRAYLNIENVGVDTIWIAFSSPATQNKGIKLDSGERLEINDLNMYRGAIYGIVVTTPSAVTYLKGQRVN